MKSGETPRALALRYGAQLAGFVAVLMFVCGVWCSGGSTNKSDCLLLYVSHWLQTEMEVQRYQAH